MSQAVNDLADLLGVPPARLAALASYADQLDVLTAAVRDRMTAESRAVDAGFTEALRFVPRLLRGPARRVLFSDGHDE